MKIYHIHTDEKNRKYIIRTDLFNENPRKCYYKRGCKEFHEYENGIAIKDSNGIEIKDSNDLIINPNY